MRLFRFWSGLGRNVVVLTACWAVASTSNLLLVSVSVLAGYALAEDKALAALPIALQWLATAGITAPVSFLMERVGRRAGFMVGSAVGMVGALVASYALYLHSFLLFCLGIGLLGAYNAFNWYFRFAASEVVDESHRSRAISLTLSGGIVAAVVGPTLARLSRGVLEPVDFAGSFAAIFLLCVLMLVLLGFVRIPKPSREDLQGGRPMGRIALQPAFLVAVLGGVVAYGVMVLFMAVTPLAMEMHDHDFADATFVIQWHVLGMYVPSFFTGHLIRRFGTLRVMLWGGALNIVCIGTLLTGESVVHFWFALMTLGVGWNFLFVGATTLLTTCHAVAERAKVQAVNEVVVFGAVGLMTFLSGTMLHHFGWKALNLAALPLVTLVILAVLALTVRRARTAT